MGILNVEIKARSENQDRIRMILEVKNAKFIGIDHQIDSYFNVPTGRLKLRQGNIENNLIHYVRENVAGPKQSKIILYKSDPESSLKKLLTKALGILVTVDKTREIYFINNVKFHIDSVKELGNFIEIEAIDESGELGEEKLLKQCEYYLNLFGIPSNHMVSVSYSDLLLK